MDKISVIGAGTMGACIAQVFASNGYEVVLADTTMEFAEKGLSMIEYSLGYLVKKEKLTEENKREILGRLKGTDNLEDCSDSALAIEAVYEDLASKQAIFQMLESILPRTSILATNTSSLSITQIASVLRHKERFAGMHFFNPANIMKLVEVIGGLHTSEETVTRICDIALAVGKTPVRVNESAGFVVNRILIPMVNEAIGVLADGVATRDDIDTAMKLGASHPMGPLTLSDLIGNDIVLAIMNVLHEETGDDKYRAHPYLKKMVRAGFLGKKTKKGFYDYE